MKRFLTHVACLVLHGIKWITYPIWRPFYFIFVELNIVGWTLAALVFMIFMLWYSEKELVDLKTVAVVSDKEYRATECWSTSHDIWNGYSNQPVSDETCDLEHYRVTITVHSLYVNEPVVWRYNIDEFYNEGSQIKIGDTLDFVAFITMHRPSGDTLDQGIRHRHFWE